MGFDMFNKKLEILKKTRCMLRKNIFFAITAAILDLENRYYFLNISVITQIEFMNIEIYILVQQIYIYIHIRLCLKLAKIRKLIVIWRPSWICTIFPLKHTHFLNRKSL